MSDAVARPPTESTETERALRLRAEAATALHERLQEIATALTAARTNDEIASAVLERGTEALGLRNAGLWLREKNALRLIGSAGYPPEWLPKFARVPLDSELPVALAALRNEALFYGSRGEYAARHARSEEDTRPAGAPQIAFAALPLPSGEAAMGVLAFAWPAEHDFDASERRFLVMLAQQTAQALQRADLLVRLSVSNQTLDAIVKASPAAVMVTELDGTVRLWNPAAEKMYGWTAAEQVGRYMLPVGEKQRAQYEEHLRALAKGGTVQGVETVRLKKGGAIDVAIWAAPLVHEDGRTQVVAVVVDISARKRIERMQRLVAETGRQLASSIGDEPLLAKVLQQAVPDFADVCFVDLLDENGALSRVALLARDEPLRARLARPWHALPKPLPRLAQGELGLRASATVPLRSRDRLLGALTLGFVSREADEQDLWLAEELSRNVALALDNARLFAREHRSRLYATRLQEVTAALSEASTPAQVAEVACRIGGETMGAISAALWLDAPGDAYALAGSWGMPRELTERFRTAPRAGLRATAREVLETRIARWFETAEATRAAEMVVAPHLPPSACAVLPLILRERVIGFLVLNHPAPHAYDASERDFYLALAHHSAQAIERAQLFEAERRSNQRLQLLAAAGAALSGTLDIGQNLAAMARLIVPSFADWCAIDLIVDGRIERTVTVAADADEGRRAHDEARAMERRAGDGSPIARTLLSDRPAYFERFPAELRKPGAHSEEQLARLSRITSVVVVPVHSDGAPACIFTIATAESGRTLSPDDRDFAVELGRRAGVSIANARAFGREQRARGRLATLQLVTAQLTRARTASEVAEVAVQQGSQALGADFSTVYQLRSQGLSLLAHHGLPEEVLARVRELGADTDWTAARAARTSAPEYLEDVRAQPGGSLAVDRMPSPIAGAVGAYAALPLRIGESVSGAMTFGFRGPHRFDVEERVFLETLAENCAQSLERARLLEEARAETSRAEQASRVKDEFLAMLGHELRNPLAPIFTALELLKLRNAPHEPERAVIERQARHLARLVDDLLDVSRIAAGRVRLEKKPVEIAEALARAIELSRPLIEGQRHALTTSIPRGLVVLGDETRLAQVISNLLTNAARYTPPGGNISVRAAREGNEIVVRVADDGLGIEPQLLPRVFELFSQGSQSFDRARGGLGLGLAIVRSLVSLHGGSVEAHSPGEGCGSEFVVRLPPLAEEAQPAAAPRALAAQPSPPAQRARVLVVDDNRDAAELLAELLTLSGFETRVAHDGPAALALDFAPDLALLDLGLPVMDGFELARRLRGKYAAVRLIAVTGYGQASDVARSQAAGFDEHIVKPVELARLEEAVARLLSQ